MTVAGIGCRKGVSCAEVLAAIDAALGRYGLSRDALDAVATLSRRQTEPGLVEAAGALGLPLVAACPEEREDVQARLLTHSEASLAATGFGSAAEAAALAAAGAGARLLGPRLATGPVTCAIATERGRQ